MRRYSKGIDGDGGGGDGGGGDDGIFPKPNRRTPDHPPYSEMVSVALRALAEENGSTESSISAYIQSTFNDLPWGHDRLLPYYLRKLVADGELTSPSPDRYILPLHDTPSVSLPIRRRGRPRLHPANPNPSFSPLPSSVRCHRGRAPLHRRRGRVPLHRRRGRPPKVHAEDTLPLQLDQGARTLRRGRGILRLRRSDSMGRTSTRRLGLRLPRSRGSKRRQNDFLDSSTEKLNCQSGNSALLDDCKNRVSECVVLVDPENMEPGHAQLEQGQQFVAPEQSEVGKGQSLGEELPLLVLEPATMLPFLGPEHYEHGKGQPLGEKPPFLAPETTEFSQDQTLLGEKLPLLTPEQGKMPSFLAPELFEPEQGQPLQGEGPPFISHAQTELVQKKLRKRPLLLSPEHDPGLPLAAPDESEDGHEQRLPEIGTADSKEDDLVLIPRPDEEEVEDAAVSSKKRKSNGRRRSLRLWFES